MQFTTLTICLCRCSCSCPCPCPCPCALFCPSTLRSVSLFLNLYFCMFLVSVFFYCVVPRIASEKCMWHKWQSATLINKIVGLLPTDSNNMHGTNNRNQQTKCDLRSEQKKRTNSFSMFVISVFAVLMFFCLLANRTMSAFFIMCQKRAAAAAAKEREIVLLASFFLLLCWGKDRSVT